MKTGLEQAHGGTGEEEKQPSERQSVQQKADEAPQKDIDPDVPPQIREGEKEDRHRPHQHKHDVQRHGEEFARGKREPAEPQAAVKRAEHHAERHGEKKRGRLLGKGQLHTLTR